MFETQLKFPLGILLLGLLVQFGCSGDKPQSEVEEPIQINDNVGLEGGNSKNQAGNGNPANSEKQSGDANSQQEDGNQVAEEKTPISEDGYDDDWNNLNSQQQKANNNKNNKKNEIANEEPPLQNAQPQQEIQENPPIQNVANQPAQQFLVDEPVVDEEPAPVPENIVQTVEEPVAPPPVAPEPSVAPVVSGAPLIKQDVEPIFAQLFWVGYDYLEKDSLVRIEIVTRGSPRYNLFQERNKSDQPELVLRFFNTRLRQKVRRDIDASQFLSPVAYVRMRADEIENSVDVIITMRDAVRPRMYSKYGNILLTFPIPDHYFGNAAIGSAPIAKAEVLANANIMPELDTDSEIPEGLKIAKAFVNNPGKDALGEIPSDAGEQVDTETLPVSNGVSSGNGELPADFVNTEIPVQEENLTIPNQNVSNNFEQNAGFGDQQSNLPFENNAEDVEEENFGENGTTQQGTDDFDFGGNQSVNAQQGATNFSEEELNGNATEPVEENTGEELDEDSLDNYEDEDDGSQEDINKFDVNNQHKMGNPGLLVAGFIVTQLSINAVAQDNFEEEEGGDFADVQSQGQSQAQGQGQGQSQIQGNVANDSNIENGSLGNSNQNAAQNENTGNFPSNEEGEEDFLNEGNGNNSEGNNFGNSGNNNLENSANNAFPTNSGNTTNTTNTTVGNGNTGNALLPANNSGNGATLNPVPPVNETVPVGEPALNENPDLAGPETEGTENENPPEESAGGRKIKLDFRGAPLREVIRVLSDESGVNFVYAPSVENLPIHISLSDIPFNDALKALLSSHSLGMVEIGPNVVKIDSLAAIAAENRAIEERRTAELRIRPTKILVHRLSYAKADLVATTIRPMLTAAASGDQRVNIQTDTRSNSIIVNAVPELLAVAKSLLDRLDLETPQVKIASRIVEIIKTNADRFGISWGTPFNLDQGRGLGFGNLVFPNYMLSRYTVDAGGTAPATGNMQFRLGSMNNTMALDLALSLEEAVGTTEILQSNDITVDDNTEASIVAGREDIMPPTGLGPQGAAQRPPVTYNLALRVTPQITGDGSVQMSIFIDSADPTEPSSPAADAARVTKTVQTKLLRRSGETAVIAGVYNSDVKKIKGGVPFFSKIPIIGALFRSARSSETKRELLIMVTPTILPSIGKGSSGGDDPVSVSLNTNENNTFNSQNGNNFNTNNQNQNNNFGNSQNQNANDNNQADTQFSNQGGNQNNNSFGNQNNNFGNQGNNAGNQANNANQSNNQNSNQSNQAGQNQEQQDTEE